MDFKKTIFSCIIDVFVMLVATGLLMEDLKFVGAVFLLGVFGHSLYGLLLTLRKERESKGEN